MSRDESVFTSAPPYYRYWQNAHEAVKVLVGDPHSYECGHGVRLTEVCDEDDCPLNCVRIELCR